jgi:hypothetical protein
MTQATQHPNVHLRTLDNGSRPVPGGFLVEEFVQRFTRNGQTVDRSRLWGVILPLNGKWQATDPDGNDVGEPVDNLERAVDILFEPVRQS